MKVEKWENWPILTSEIELCNVHAMNQQGMQPGFFTQPRRLHTKLINGVAMHLVTPVQKDPYANSENANTLVPLQQANLLYL